MSDTVFWFRFAPDKFGNATRHLSATELGHHIRLITLAWGRTTCSVPANPEWICRRLGTSADEYLNEVEPVLNDLWELSGEDWRNAWLEKERERALERSENGRNAANARHSRKHSSSGAKCETDLADDSELEVPF